MVVAKRVSQRPEGECHVGYGWTAFLDTPTPLFSDYAFVRMVHREGHQVQNVQIQLSTHIFSSQSSAIRLPVFSPASRRRVAEDMAIWRDLSLQTHGGLPNLFKTYITPTLPTLNLEELTPADLEWLKKHTRIAEPVLGVVLNGHVGIVMSVTGKGRSTKDHVAYYSIHYSPTNRHWVVEHTWRLQTNANALRDCLVAVAGEAVSTALKKFLM